MYWYNAAPQYQTEIEIRMPTTAFRRPTKTHFSGAIPELYDDAHERLQRGLQQFQLNKTVLKFDSTEKRWKYYIRSQVPPNAEKFTSAPPVVKCKKTTLEHRI